jgi:hypothetical protein
MSDASALRDWPAMIASTLERLQHDAQASALLFEATNSIEKAMLLNREADIAPGGYEAQAFLTESLEHLVRRQAITVKNRAIERATQLGWQVATYEIAPEARESGNESTVFITGNRYMPPLRAYGVSEDVWNLDEPECWEAYSEAIERRLEKMNVLMDAPEHDNSLYVVDLARFEYVDEEDQYVDGDLSDQWRPIETS